MHPPLAEHAHTQCAAAMQAIKDCHANNPYLKFFGVCNDEKTALNMCLRGERVNKAVDNRDKAREKRKEVERRWREIEAESAAPPPPPPSASTAPSEQAQRL